jgi:hypothetical protein
VDRKHSDKGEAVQLCDVVLARNFTTGVQRQAHHIPSAGQPGNKTATALPHTSHMPQQLQQQLQAHLNTGSRYSCSSSRLKFFRSTKGMPLAAACARYCRQKHQQQEAAEVTKICSSRRSST